MKHLIYSTVSVEEYTDLYPHTQPHYFPSSSSHALNTVRRNSNVLVLLFNVNREHFKIAKLQICYLYKGL